MREAIVAAECRGDLSFFARDARRRRSRDAARRAGARRQGGLSVVRPRRAAGDAGAVRSRAGVRERRDRRRRQLCLRSRQLLPDAAREGQRAGRARARPLPVAVRAARRRDGSCRASSGTAARKCRTCRSTWTSPRRAAFNDRTGRRWAWRSRPAPRSRWRRAAVPVRLYVFDGGILESDPGRYRLTKEDVGETRLSVACYLVAHPRGVLMWDTCAVPDAEWTPTGQPVAQRLVLADGAGAASHDPVVARGAAESRRACAPTDVTHSGAVAPPLGSHGQRQRVCRRDLARAAGRARGDVRREAAPAPCGRQTYARLRTSKSVAVTAARARRVRRRHRDPQAGARPHARAPGALRQAAQDRRCAALGRPLSLPAGAHDEPLPDLRVQRGADAGVACRCRGVPEADRRRSSGSSTTSPRTRSSRKRRSSTSEPDGDRARPW